jgi:NAD dependent epimerase/dehydratase
MFLKDKRVLVTGADGFIGSHLVEFLHGRCAHVRALVMYNSFNNWGNLEGSPCLDDIEVVAGDVRDPFMCNNVTKDIDVIFNLAALIAIPYSYAAPQSYVETNIGGALNICQAALADNAQKIIQISTSEVYGTAKYTPIDENHPLAPQSPYSASKIGADSIAMSFYNAFDLPVTIARPFNTYGPRQSARAFIPTIITQIAAGQKEIRLGDLTPTRDLTYVSDTCEGLLRIAESDKTVGEIVNIGSNYEISVGQVFDKICEIMGADAKAVQDGQRMRPAKSEVQRLWCDNSKIKELTGFVPKYNIDTGLKKTVEWFSDEKNLKRYKGDIYNT